MRVVTFPLGKADGTKVLKGSTDSYDTPSSRDTAGSVEDISSFVEQLAREFLLDAPERRNEPRYRVTLPVIVQPLDDDCRPVGSCVRAVTRELSATGIGLICQDPLNAKIVLQIASSSGGELRILAQVVRCVTSGYYYDVGCRFLSPTS